MSTHTITEAYDPATGITERYHFQDGEIVLEKVFDMEPYLVAAAEARAMNAGQPWGAGKKIGTIPPPFYASTIHVKDPQERQKAIKDFFRKYPALLHFDRYIL